MPVRPTEGIKPPAKPLVRSRADYAQMRQQLIDRAREECVIAEGIDRDTAVKIRKAIHKPSKHFFAVVRSGRNLPDECEGPAVVQGGYALSQEVIDRITGKPTTTE